VKAGEPFSKLQEDIHYALKAWHKPDTGSSPLGDLHIFQQARLRGTRTARQAANELLLKALETLSVEYEVEAALLRKRFLDGLVMHAAANWLNVGESTAYRIQQTALEQLARIVHAREVQAREGFQNDLEKRLKLPPEVDLFGVEESLTALLDVLMLAKSPWLISVEGLGGIGKTALANALLRRPELTHGFYNIAWVSAKQQSFVPGLGLEQSVSPALTVEALVDALLEQLDQSISLNQSLQVKRSALSRVLKQNPHLIVIDNLETLVDYQVLLPTLRDWANPSKFVLTSRHSLREHPDVFCHTLTELDQNDTLQFIKHEARVRGLSILANVSEAELKSIYQVVGGNPLALKLIVGQVAILPLSQVLENLKQAKVKDIDELYTFIYWQAWHTLDEISQRVLLMMPVAQDGPPEQLKALSGLELSVLSQALQRLVSLSLVQVSGTLEERRYTIHRLTETFLLNEAIKWQIPP
jgi:hypothetical protein